METQSICKSESKIGKTRFIITEKCSPNAKETIDEKLLKIMNRHILETPKLPCNVQKSTL